MRISPIHKASGAALSPKNLKIYEFVRTFHFLTPPFFPFSRLLPSFFRRSLLFLAMVSLDVLSYDFANGAHAGRRGNL